MKNYYMDIAEMEQILRLSLYGRNEVVTPALISQSTVEAGVVILIYREWENYLNQHNLIVLAEKVVVATYKAFFKGETWNIFGQQIKFRGVDLLVPHI